MIEFHDLINCPLAKKWKQFNIVMNHTNDFLVFLQNSDKDCLKKWKKKNENKTNN